MSDRQDVARAEETVESLEQRLKDLNAEFEEEAAKLDGDTSCDSDSLEEVQVRPKKADITVMQVALAWTPWIVSPDGRVTPAWE